jgi:drug/metabolite transporter (DMT)-like permease
MCGAMALTLLIRPLVGTAFAVLIRGEHPSLATAFGDPVKGLLILAGVSTGVTQRSAAVPSAVSHFRDRLRPAPARQD